MQASSSRDTRQTCSPANPRGKTKLIAQTAAVWLVYELIQAEQMRKWTKALHIALLPMHGATVCSNIKDMCGPLHPAAGLYSRERERERER
jgi:hypothetical protein